MHSLCTIRITLVINIAVKLHPRYSIAPLYSTCWEKGTFSFFYLVHQICSLIIQTIQKTTIIIRFPKGLIIQCTRHIKQGGIHFTKKHRTKLKLKLGVYNKYLVYHQFQKSIPLRYAYMRNCFPYICLYQIAYIFYSEAFINNHSFNLFKTSLHNDKSSSLISAI